MDLQASLRKENNIYWRHELFNMSYLHKNKVTTCFKSKKHILGRIPISLSRQIIPRCIFSYHPGTSKIRSAFTSRIFSFCCPWIHPLSKTLLKQLSYVAATDSFFRKLVFMRLGDRIPDRIYIYIYYKNQNFVNYQ